MPLARILLLLGIVLATEPALAMRCKGKLVKEGDHLARVLKYCGGPTAVQRRTIYRSGVPTARANQEMILNGTESGLPRQELLIHDRSFEEVLVEEWTYNLGPNRLMRVVRFENGIVVEVTRLGYGYHD
jgi:Protein of unknown function (DUF2845)